MPNGMSSRPYCHRPSLAGVPVRLHCARSSTPSSTSAVAAVLGGCYRRTFRPIRRSTTTSETGARTARGRDSMMLCGIVCVRKRGGKSAQAQRSSIVRVPRRRKGGPQGLRCGQESPGPQAAYPRRHPRLARRLRGSRSGSPGSRRGEAGV